MVSESKVRRVPNSITSIRLNRKILQRELAERIRVSPQDMNHIEHGRRLPTRSQARAIARALTCKVEDLYAGSWLAAILEGENGS